MLLVADIPKSYGLLQKNQAGMSPSDIRASLDEHVALPLSATRAYKIHMPSERLG